MQGLANVRFHQVQPVGIVNQVYLRQNDQSGRDLQQVEDSQVFTRLGHHALVGRDDQQRGVNAAHAGQHILDEVAVAGHVHDADLLAVWQGQPGEAEVNGHLALLLFLEAVRVDTCERGDEGGFTVIYVSGGADNAHVILWKVWAWEPEQRNFLCFRRSQDAVVSRQ